MMQRSQQAKWEAEEAGRVGGIGWPTPTAGVAVLLGFAEPPRGASEPVTFDGRLERHGEGRESEERLAHSGRAGRSTQAE
jgi:hypothetical protein